MSCSCDDTSEECNKACDCRIPSYTNDTNFTGITVNVAVLEQKINTIKEEDSHIIELSPTYLAYASFQAMFYRQTDKFIPLNGVSGSIWQQFLANFNRQVVYSSFSSENANFGWTYDNVFNLAQTITAGYVHDLEVPIECWDPCSVIEFTTTLGGIQYLTDVGNQCNIKCSITLDDFFDNLQAQGLTIDSATGLPLDPQGLASNPPVRIIYTGLVNALITANFRSCTPGVKDIKVKWPFLINFNSVTPATAAGGPNMVDGINEPLGNIWPWINYVDNGTVPTTQLRSPELLYDTVDTTGMPYTNNVDFPNSIIPSNIKPYGRYTAYLYSSIHTL
uniref:Uncharacterized protein n=1 Tax=viral metagenome TaxID=1070528 RepID=A0A6C0HGA1_9ZZZZ